MKIDFDIMNGQESKYEQAYKAIKQGILSKRLEPNTLLVERRLSDALNISRTPIRQVLQQLANEGFVEYVANKGMFVTEFNVLDAIEIYTIREVVDPLMLEGSFTQNFETSAREMGEVVAKQSAALAKNDAKEYVKHDLEFHNVYINHCGYKRLQTFMFSMLEHIKRCAYMSDDLERARLSNGQHIEIFEAYNNKDIVKAKELIAAHMVSVKQYYLGKIS